MSILDDQARQQMTLHFQLSLQCNVSCCMPDEAHDGQNVASMWQLEVKSHLLACFIVQSNHSTINSSMPNNFHVSYPLVTQQGRSSECGNVIRISYYSRFFQNKLILSLKLQPFWGLAYLIGVSTSLNGLCLCIKAQFNNLLFCDALVFHR